MNSRERFMAVLNGQRPDRPPLAHVSALTTVAAQEKTGLSMPAVHHDPEQLAALCWANHEMFGFDAVTFIINFFNEPAALGCAMDWGQRDKLPMYLSVPWKNPDDVIVPNDILDRKPISTYLETIKIAKRKYGDKVAVLGKIMGPFSMVQVMHGIENVMMGVITDPAPIMQFLDATTDILIKCANAQFDAGIDALAIGEGGAGANMLSPQLYESILLEVHRRLIAGIHGPVIMHICGDIKPRLPMLAKTGMACFNFDWNIAPQLMKESCGGAFKLMGNISTSDLLTGTPDDIRRQVFENLDAGIDIISPGCAVSPLCPNENINAMHQAITQWRYK